MKYLLYILLPLIITACNSSKNVNTKDLVKEDESYGLKQKTENPNTPFIYKNGFKKKEIIISNLINEKDNSNFNELRFNAVASSMYTQKVMYDAFGNWSNHFNSKDNNHIAFIWQNVKLFESSSELYTIVANGKESREEIFASVIVYDSKNNDCLKIDSPARMSIINYFSNGIRNLNDDKTFYLLYHNTKATNL